LQNLVITLLARGIPVDGEKQIEVPVQKPSGCERTPSTHYWSSVQGVYQVIFLEWKTKGAYITATFTLDVQEGKKTRHKFLKLEPLYFVTEEWSEIIKFWMVWK
jgi:hypothetical protein